MFNTPTGNRETLTVCLRRRSQQILAQAAVRVDAMTRKRRWIVRDRFVHPVEDAIIHQLLHLTYQFRFSPSVSSNPGIDDADSRSWDNPRIATRDSTLNTL